MITMRPTTRPTRKRRVLNREPQRDRLQQPRADPERQSRKERTSRTLVIRVLELDVYAECFAFDGFEDIHASSISHIIESYVQTI